MIYHDITLELSGDIAVYPGDPRCSITKLCEIGKGDAVNMSGISLTSHTGTHMDAPAHFIEGGLTVDRIPASTFIGKAKVFEIVSKDAIKACDICRLDMQKGDVILFKTGNSSFVRDEMFHREYTYIAPDAAEIIAQKGVKMVGIDYMSVDRYDSTDFEAHKTFLGNGIIIIENIDLNGIKPGEYGILALPLKVKGGDGSPARVILTEEL